MQKHFLLKFQIRSSLSGDPSLPVNPSADQHYSASMTKSHKKYICRRASGLPTVLQDLDSDVKLHIPEETYGLLIGCVLTSFASFLSVVPEDECFVAPVPDFTFIPDEQPNAQQDPEFSVEIPQTLGDSASEFICVRHGDIHKREPFELLSSSTTPRYTVDSSKVTVSTRSFSQFVCTSCHTLCRNRLKALIFGKVFAHNGTPRASVRAYLASNLYGIKDFRKVQGFLSFVEAFHCRAKGFGTTERLKEQWAFCTSSCKVTVSLPFWFQHLVEVEALFGRVPVTERDVGVSVKVNLDDKLVTRTKCDAEWGRESHLLPNETWDRRTNTLTQASQFVGFRPVKLELHAPRTRIKLIIRSKISDQNDWGHLWSVLSPVSARTV